MYIVSNSLFCELVDNCGNLILIGTYEFCMFTMKTMTKTQHHVSFNERVIIYNY
jgi:hypothetical protein